MANLKKSKRKSHLPKDENGKVKAGPGRGKGTPNKITGEAKHMIALAFEGIGGVDQLIAWAAEHQTAFYTQVYTKLIPMMVGGKIGVDVNVRGDEARQKLQSAFLALINAERSQLAREVSKTPVIIDDERNREPVPQLVVSRKTGTTST